LDLDLNTDYGSISIFQSQSRSHSMSPYHLHLLKKKTDTDSNSDKSQRAAARIKRVIILSSIQIRHTSVQLYSPLSFVPDSYIPFFFGQLRWLLETFVNSHLQFCMSQLMNKRTPFECPFPHIFPIDFPWIFAVRSPPGIQLQVP